LFVVVSSNSNRHLLTLICQNLTAGTKEGDLQQLRPKNDLIFERQCSLVVCDPIP
ncbi:hypothetical protein AVEN_90592-1, partial [Araneus ventricosus]